MFAVALVDCGSLHLARLAAALTAADCTIRTVALARANATDFSSSRAVVVSGGPMLFTDPGVSEDLIEQFAFLDGLRTPLLGICLGHQALGIRAGATVYRGAERRCEEQITLAAEHGLFRGLPKTFAMTTDHCEGIRLAQGYVRLAASRYYPVEAMASERLPHFGVQFHPEISGAAGRTLIGNFLQLAGHTGNR